MNLETVRALIDCRKAELEDVEKKLSTLQVEQETISNEMASLKSVEQRLCPHSAGYSEVTWINNAPVKYCPDCGKEH